MTPNLVVAQNDSVVPIVTVDFAVPSAFSPNRLRSVLACRAAVRLVYDSVQQHWNGDTLYDDGMRSTPVDVVKIARQCLKMFPVGNLDNLDLESVLQIAFYAGDTVAIQNVTGQMLLRRTSVGHKARGFVRILSNAQLYMEPISVPYLYNILSRLDSLGPEARSMQLAARRKIYRTCELSGLRPDSMLLVGQQMLRGLEHNEVSGKLVDEAFEDSVTEFKRDIARDIAWYAYLLDGTSKTFQEWQYLARLERGIVGRLAPAIQGNWWMSGSANNLATQNPFGVNGLQFADQVTIVMPVVMRYPGLHLGAFDLLKRIRQRYPMIHIILIAQTSGGVQGIRIENAKDEATLIGKVLLDSLMLPVLLNVSEGASDTSRRNSFGVPVFFNSETYRHWNSDNRNGIYLVNRTGYVVRQIDRNQTTPMIMFMMLDRLLTMDNSTGISRERD